MFAAATPAGIPVTVNLAVSHVDPEAHVADLTTRVVHATGDTGLDGRTRVHLPTHPTPFTGTLPSALQSTRAEARMPIDQSSSLPAFHSFLLGQSAATTRTFTQADLAEYADLTGDDNPIYLDAAYATRRGLEGPIVPGPLLGGLFSYLLGTRLPGRGTNYLKQRLIFPAPAYRGEPLTATVEIARLRPEKELVNLTTICTRAQGQVVCHGEALVLARDVRYES